MGNPTLKKIMLSSAMIASIVFLWWCYRLTLGRPLNIDHFYLRTFGEYLWHEPELLTRFGFIENTLADFHSDELTDVSPAEESRKIERNESALNRLNQYDSCSLNSEEKLSYDIFHWYLSDEVGAKPYLYHDYIINQYESVHKDLPVFLSDSHQVVDERSAWNYVARLLAFDKKIGQLIEAQQVREGMGVIPPRHIIQQILSQIDSFLQTPINESLLLLSFEKKLKELPGINCEGKDHLMSSAKLALKDVVYPSYQNLKIVLTALLLKAPEQIGIWILPDGDAYYEYLLKHYTTTALSPDEIHQIGLKELGIVKNEIKLIQSDLGMQNLPFKQFIAQISKDKNQLFDNTPAGREEALEYVRDQLASAKKFTSQIVNCEDIPEIQVRRMAEDMQETSPPVILVNGSVDGKRETILEFNLMNMNELPKYTLLALVVHEAYPGHHLQHIFQHHLKDTPMFRKVLHFSAYSEGWAMYSERLALELGLTDSPVSKIGLLQSQLWRAVRLIVDTGIHKYRWSRQQAIEFMVEQTGMHRDMVTREIDRYIVKPGQACSYIIGMKKYLELRETYKSQKGEAFDLKQFHYEVLSDGAMPLKILRQNILQHIKKDYCGGIKENGDVR